MSRVVEHNETFSGKPTSFSASSDSNTTNGNNGLNFHTNTSSYSSLKSGKRNQYYTNYYFTVEGISSNATITSASCQFRAKIQGTGSTYIGSAQLYSNSTVKGSSVSINQAGTNGVVYTISDAEFTLSELSNIYLNILHPLGGNNRYVYFYGATLTVNYTWYETFYSISTSSNVQGVSISSTSGETLEGGSNTITLSNVSDISSIKVMDNGNDITSLFTRSGSNYAYTLTGINADHTIVVEDNSSPYTNSKRYVKKNGSFVESTNQYVKESNSWINRTISKIFWGINGSWNETTDPMSGTTAFKIEI